MPYIIAIVGLSNSGKTTLVERLIPLLLAKGLRLGSVKHSCHSFALDQEGKDSHRHKSAGTICTVLSGPQQIAVFRDAHSQWGLTKIVNQFLADMDLVIAEGFKQDTYDKIELLSQNQVLIHEQDEYLLAYVTGEPQAQIPDAKPRFLRDDVSSIADFIFNRYQARPRTNSLRLFVNGKKIPTKGFVEQMMLQAIRGMVSSLKGVQIVKNIRLELDIGQDD